MAAPRATVRICSSAEEDDDEEEEPEDDEELPDPEPESELEDEPFETLRDPEFPLCESSAASVAARALINWRFK